MKLETEINRQDYMDFNKFHYYKTSLKKTNYTFFIGFAVFQLFLNRHGFDMFATIIATIVGLIFLYYAMNYNFTNTKKIPMDDGAILGKSDIELTDESLIMKNKNSFSNYDWAAIKSIENGKTALYLYLDTNMAIIIPKRHFKNELEEDDFTDFVEARITVG